MNPMIIEALRTERQTLETQLSAVETALAALTPQPILFAAREEGTTQTVAPTNGHTNGNGTNGHATASKELVNLSRPNGATRRGPGRPRLSKTAKFDRVLRNMRKPGNVGYIYEIAQKMAPEFTRTDVGIYASNAYKGGKLTRHGEKGSYVYTAVQS